MIWFAVVWVLCSVVAIIAFRADHVYYVKGIPYSYHIDVWNWFSKEILFVVFMGFVLGPGGLILVLFLTKLFSTFNYDFFVKDMRE